jgi:NADPH-dependent 2,4-dienoyl-CoA reductase/sulfur reductase-like enzyme
MSTIAYDVAIVGGGPAGLAAAEMAAGRDARVVLIDSSSTLGGHYYKVLPETFSGPLSALDYGHKEAFQTRVEKLLRANNVDILYDTSVWGVFQGTEATFGDSREPPVIPDDTAFALWLDTPASTPRAVEARALVLVPGAYDRPIPFPGWTLPGVLTPGAVQMSLKKQGIVPGERILVAGTGPLQIAVAAAIADEGAKVVALLDTCSAGEGTFQSPGAIWGQWKRISEAAVYARSLLKHRIPLKFQHAVYRAIGTPEAGVQAAVIGRIDVEGQPILGTEQTLEVDTVCVAYGFAPSIELSLHLGCDHDYNPKLGEYFPRHDERMQTTMKGVFVAGDVTGVGGKAMADLQGQVAGISSLEILGAVSEAEANAFRAHLRPMIQRERRFARWLWRRFRIKPGLFSLVGDETLVCRCENVTAGQIRESFAQGARDLRGMKLRTRMGMGICQGRYCAANAAAILAQEAGCSPEKMGTMSIRPPVIPVRTKNMQPVVHKAK